MQFDTVVLISPSAQTLKYAIQYWKGDRWESVAQTQDLRAGPTLVTFSPVTAQKIRFLAEGATTAATISELEVFDDSERGIGPRP